MIKAFKQLEKINRKFITKDQSLKTIYYLLKLISFLARKQKYLEVPFQYRLPVITSGLNQARLSFKAFSFVEQYSRLFTIVNLQGPQINFQKLSYFTITSFLLVRYVLDNISLFFMLTKSNDLWEHKSHVWSRKTYLALQLMRILLDIRNIMRLQFEKIQIKIKVPYYKEERQHLKSYQDLSQINNK